MVRGVAPHFSYPGTVEIIREAIRRLAPEEKWVSPYGDCVEICECKWLPDGNPSSGFGDWALRLKSMDPKDRGRCAAIHARLAPEGQRTNVMYRNGRDLAWFLEEPKPMGEVFEDFLWAVFREVHWIVGRRTAQAEGQVTTPDEDGVGRPNKVGEYLRQEEAASGSGGDGADRSIDSIRVPKKQLVLKRWKVTWRKIKGQWEQARSYTDMCNWLQKMHPDLAYSADTLKHIIRAGEAGMLE